MLQVARLSRKQLGDSAGLTLSFLKSQINEDGGFQDRSGNSDLYYTVFGLESFTALSEEIPPGPTLDYLRSFGEGANLDFVHLACLARCWANVSRDLLDVPRAGILNFIESYRTADGGYNAARDARHGTVYACFLALGAYQDLQCEMPRRVDLASCIESLRARDGGYANQPGAAAGLTPPSAAAATLLRQLDQHPDAALGEWLLARRRPEGGFFASPQTPIPDLLSTATALHALSGMQMPINAIREPCLDFIDSLWTNRGGFYGNWTDDALDCEYLYYGLLALGHLSL